MKMPSVKILFIIILTSITLTTYGQKPRFKYVGKGTLVSKNGDYYRIAQFKRKSDLVRLIGDLENLCREEYGCVGFHYKVGSDKEGYLEGALLFDADKVKWPYKASSKYGFKSSWYSETTRECKSKKWCGTGQPSLVTTSVDVGKGWEDWLCWGRVNPEEKKGNHQTDFNWPKKYRLTTKFQGRGKSLSVVKEGRNYNVQLAPTKESSEQYWRIIKDKDGYHYLESMSLDKYGCAMIVSNNQVKLLVTTENDEKRLWKIEKLNNGYYRLTTKPYGKTKSLDIVNDMSDNKLILASSGNYTGQFWEITEIK